MSIVKYRSTNLFGHYIMTSYVSQQLHEHLMRDVRGLATGNAPNFADFLAQPRPVPGPPGAVRAATWPTRDDDNEA